MKTKYILHGGFTRDDNDENKKFFSECFEDVPKKANILIVLFATEGGGDIEYYENFCNRLQTFTDKELTFTKADQDNFIHQVQKADAVFLQGGDTNRLISALEKYSDLSELFKGKTIIGSSAGAYALAVLCTSHSEAVVRKGLGILPLRVVCHYQSDRMSPNKASFEEIKTSRKDLELILLKDYGYKTFSLEG